MNEVSNFTLTSIEVAEMIEKTHKDVIRDIRRYTEQLAGGKIAPGDFWEESTYKDANGQDRPCYNVTKMGCEFIAHKMTGVKGATFTAKYIEKFHDMEAKINEQSKPLTTLDQIKLIAQGHVELSQRVDTVETKVNELENTMNLDYGQQNTLGEVVNKTVLSVLGGKGSNAYNSIGKKVFAECNHDLKAFFKVNARANVPKKRFEEAIKYAENWKPCTNTIMLINDANAQENFVF